MDRHEALRTLGLQEGATEAEVKQAYKEMAQILHPDKQNGNEALKKRAEEQFKQVNAARDLLINGRSHAPRDRTSNTRAGAQAQASWQPPAAAGSWSSQLDAIAAARAQLVAQRDAVLESRRLGLWLFVIGAIACAVPFLRRFYVVLLIAPVAAITGLIKFVTAQNQVAAIDKRLAELERMRQAAEMQR
jgi:hypothetical protein